MFQTHSALKRILCASRIETVLWTWVQSTVCMQTELKLYFGPGPKVQFACKLDSNCTLGLGPKYICLVCVLLLLIVWHKSSCKQYFCSCCLVYVLMGSCSMEFPMLVPPKKPGVTVSCAFATFADEWSATHALGVHAAVDSKVSPTFVKAGASWILHIYIYIYIIFLFGTPQCRASSL